VSLRPSAFAALLVLTACTRETYRNADLQLDILAPQPAFADRVRVCVEGVRTRTVGAGDGRYAVPGLPSGVPAEITVQVLVEADAGEMDDTGTEALIAVASTGRVSLTEQDPWLEVELEHFAHSDTEAQACDSCPEPCRTTTTATPEDDDSWLLATRFLD